MFSTQRAEHVRARETFGRGTVRIQQQLMACQESRRCGVEGEHRAKRANGRFFRVAVDLAIPTESNGPALPGCNNGI